MKVPILEKEWLGAVREIVSVSIKGHNINFKTDAMIDSGSPKTFISTIDLRTKTRIPFSSYKKEALVKIGGAKMYMIDLGQCELTFYDIDNKPISITHHLFGGIATTQDGYSIPTIIGKDFLDEHSLNIIGKTGKKYLVEYTGD